MESRRHNFQTLAWFFDIYQRSLLDLDPPYQRRSVWNQSFKDYFIETVLLGYPAPAVFLYEEIDLSGGSTYHVVDGKQRLNTVFSFAKDDFPLSEISQLSQFRGNYFSALPDGTKRNFWTYTFLVEYLPDVDETLLQNIFDRINRNTVKLSPQELRHAKFDGEFISHCETLTEWLASKAPKDFPRFAAQSRSQMKDVEFVATLLLLVEEGPKSASQADLDEAFSERDIEWPERIATENLFREAITKILEFINFGGGKFELAASRLRNQADFYSLLGAIIQLMKDSKSIDPELIAIRMADFLLLVDDRERRESNKIAKDYFGAARSASNDKGPRSLRIDILKQIITGQLSQ